MTTAITLWTPEQTQLISSTIAPGCSNDELRLFAYACQRTGLDPFSKPIYAIKRGGKMTIQAGIDGLRAIAERTGQLDGSETYWCGDDGQWADVWLSSKPHAAAKTIIHRKGSQHPFVGVARFADYNAGHITQADMSAPNVTNSATASGAGQTSAPVTTTITNLSSAAATQTANAVLTSTVAPSPSNLPPGSTIQHQVAVGEWLMQIGRCYGASFDDMRNASPQIADPDFILPAMVVTVPRIGSVGRIYGPPCITFHTVQSGDTWAAIAQRYNADLVVLQRVNPVTLTAGTRIKIPLNSAGSLPVIAPTAAPVATATATISVATQRIMFGPGETTASRVGIVNPNETIRYVLTATAGPGFGFYRYQ